MHPRNQIGPRWAVFPVARHDGVAPVEVDAERFDESVERALDEIPPVIAARVRNLVVLVEDQPPEDQLADLLGRYDGVALTHRDSLGAPDDR